MAMYHQEVSIETWAEWQTNIIEKKIDSIRWIVVLLLLLFVCLLIVWRQTTTTTAIIITITHAWSYGEYRQKKCYYSRSGYNHYRVYVVGWIWGRRKGSDGR